MNDYEDKEKLKKLLEEKKSGDDLQRSHYGLPPSNIHQYNEVTLSPEEVKLYKKYLTNPPHPDEPVTMDYKTYQVMRRAEDYKGYEIYGGKKNKSKDSNKKNKPNMYKKKIILGKERCIYKIPGSRKDYVKYKGKFIIVKNFIELNK